MLRSTGPSKRSILQLRSCRALTVDDRIRAHYNPMTMQPFILPGLNVRELQALVSIAHFGSLIGAAAFLQTSQSALSRTVTRIEKVVGVRLFVQNCLSNRAHAVPAGNFVAVGERVLNDP